MKNLKLIAFVQNDATKEVLHAIQVDVDGKLIFAERGIFTEVSQVSSPDATRPKSEHRTRLCTPKGVVSQSPGSRSHKPPWEAKRERRRA